MKAAEAEDFSYLRWQEVTDASCYVNSTAISGDGTTVVAGSFYHIYTPQMAADGIPAQQSTAPTTFTTYCYSGEGKLLWSDPFEGYQGVYAVAVSGDGSVAASGGWYSHVPLKGFVRAYNVAKGPPYLFHYPLNARVNALALSQDGSTIVAAADQVYLFQADNGVFPAEPAVLELKPPPTGQTIPNSAQAVAISSDGTIILVGDYYGNVYYVSNDNGKLGTPYIWSNTTLTRLHTIAMTPSAGWFAASGNDSTVYVFSDGSMTGNPTAVTGTLKLDTGRIGWIAISDNGQFLTAVGNIGNTGTVVGIANGAGGTLTKLWETPTAHNPNSTSMTADGKYVTAADGYPDGNPGTFYLFAGATGKQIWSYPTTNMNWPMFISPDGSGIAAGSDNGTLYYFTPTEAKG
ncbi:MAG TPA: WD40 repeat domain-containing protein [Pyrinomonadaceae bacterium]|nr:WD40 repeat domain-containing protein [Pyrinomonadaceae bacterium]